MTITITIPNAKVQKLLDAIGYTTDSGAQDTFIKNYIKANLQNSVMGYENQRALLNLVPTDIGIT